MYSAYTQSSCYRYGTAGRLARDIAMTFGASSWVALVAVARRTHQVYMLGVLLFYALAGVWLTTLQLLFNEPRANSATCNWVDPDTHTMLDGMPAQPVFIAFLYLAVTMVHTAANGGFAKNRWQVLFVCVVIGAVPTLAIVNGLYTLRQTILSALIASLLGCAFMIPLQTTWFTYCDIAARSPLLRTLGWTHRADDLYNCNMWAL